MRIYESKLLNAFGWISLIASLFVSIRIFLLDEPLDLIDENGNPSYLSILILALIHLASNLFANPLSFLLKSVSSASLAACSLFAITTFLIPYFASTSYGGVNFNSLSVTALLLLFSLSYGLDAINSLIKIRKSNKKSGEKFIGSGDGTPNDQL